MRRNYALVFPLILLLSVAATCSSSAVATAPADPLTIVSPQSAADATNAYAALADLYSTARQTAVQLRAANRITDAQWTQIIGIERNVTAADPVIASLLQTWVSSGTKPAGFDAQLAQFHASVTALNSAVQH
jgi:uncharacterized protein YukE